MRLHAADDEPILNKPSTERQAFAYIFSDRFSVEGQVVTWLVGIGI
ncbi:hypothetical protein [Sporomusa rhizae]